VNDTYIQEAFHQTLPKAQKSERYYVSLYACIPYYGGPEEGGWWGEDRVLCATEAFNFEDEADAAKEKIQELADRLQKQAQREYGENCRRECDWLDERGLDADYLPEPDGPTRYFVVVEPQRGMSESTGCRHYE
jgi:hypothetical protein